VEPSIWRRPEVTLRHSLWRTGISSFSRFDIHSDLGVKLFFFFSVNAGFRDAVPQPRELLDVAPLHHRHRRLVRLFDPAHALRQKYLPKSVRPSGKLGWALESPGTAIMSRKPSDIEGEG